MEFSELILESFSTLAANKIRTGLAMLGVIIGIGSVIALMSLGQGSQKSITAQIQSLGTNLITIRPGAVQSSGVRGAAGGSDTLTMDDAEAIAELPTISAIAPLISSNSQIVAGRNNSNNSVYGVTAGYIQVNNLDIASGSFITDTHVTKLSRVAVIGPTVTENLFGEGVNPIGQQIRIDGQAFTVIGETTSKGGTGFNNTDEMIYVPISVAQKILYGLTNLSSLSVSATNEDVMEEAKTEVTNLLLTRHKIANADEADFSVMSQEDLLGTISEVTGTFTALLAGIAAISLVVGGIGIMNIMLVTVTERTKEIGLRKALGAKKSTVIAQFLTEAIMITFLGGVIGVLLGILVSYVITRFIAISFTIDLGSIFLAFGVSVIIGIVFGWYPSKKASDLQPIEALRYE